MSQPGDPRREYPSAPDHARLALALAQAPTPPPPRPPPPHIQAATAHSLDHQRPDDLPYTPVSPATASEFKYEDSPTLGKPQTGGRPQQPAQTATRPSPITITTILPNDGTAYGPRSSSLPTTPLSSSGARFRKPAPSPLHNTTAVSPPTSPSPNGSTSNQPFALHDACVATLSPESFSSGSLTTPETAELAAIPSGPIDADTSHYNSDPNGTGTTDKKQAIGPSLGLRIANEQRSVSDPISKPSGAIHTDLQAMPGSSRMEAVKAPPRNSSIDSAISAISTGIPDPKNAPSVACSSADIAKLVKAAGSPDAVIQYLLKEKQSQTQQNAQLWRLVDKQRAMILGLNKDLERALKDKEKYRRKLKEVVTSRSPLVAASPAAGTGLDNGWDQSPVRAESAISRRPSSDIPASPSAGSDGSKLSPIDVGMAPYPITPPADHINNGTTTTVGDMLDPERAMPEASKHAFDEFDHDAEERKLEDARRQHERAAELSLDEMILPLAAPGGYMPPPQSEPPAPPQPADVDDGLSQFPAPPTIPPRKAPPAPLQLQTKSPVAGLVQDEGQSDLDFEVDQITAAKRGRRRTRHEDDEVREILVLKEAEARSLSKKSKNSNSGKETPSEAPPEIQLSPTSPKPTSSMLKPSDAPGSLAGVLNGTAPDKANTSVLGLGLPTSPRPLTMSPGPHSPPLSPDVEGGTPALLSPRAPRSSIPLPPNTPLQTPSPHEALALKSPQLLHSSRKAFEHDTVNTPTSSRESATERFQVFKGFTTEEFPEMLITPDALIAVNVKVASSRMKPSRASLISLTQLEEDPVFTLAILSRADGGELWRVEKDSLSLAKLDGKLKQCADCTARTPERSLFSGHAPARLDARRRALDQYFEEVLNTPLDRDTALEMCKYLSTNVLPPNADEIGSSTAQDDEGGPRLGPGGRQYKNGYLTKRGKNFGGWKARFFVVDGPLLKYYETPGGAHLGTIKLQGAQIGRQSCHTEATSPNAANDEMDNQYRHAFLILEPKKKDPTSMTKHVLCAESDKERDLWVNVLLPWTSYKDPADGEHKKAKDQQEPNSAHVKGSNTKKKTQSQGRSQQQVAKEADAVLIGVSYETTKQGDIPLSEHAEPAATVSSQPAYAISAPQNPQWIPDPGLFTNKMSGLAPGMDDKKAKKRSFFGFGPKQRSFSDGTDSLSMNDHGIASTIHRDGNHGPIRRVFGAPLVEAVKYNSPRDVRVPLPAVVYRCIQYLEARGAVNEEGIFRLSGSNIVIKALKERFDNEGDINLVEDAQYHDIHAVASMMKAYLRELPTSILTRDLHLEFAGVTEMKSQDEKIAALRDLVARLPLANLTLLRYLIAFLIKIIAHADRNKMTVRNVGIVFSPTLTIPAPVFALFLQHYERIFGMSPQEYDLPSPASTSLDERSDKESIEIPPRPSTSGGLRESPHRHRLAEALADQRRGNTPPPVHSAHPLAALSNSRSTPTPPPAQRYDSNPFAHQMVGSASGRPPYESPVGPSGFDPMQYYLAQQRQMQQTPAYDQPHTSRASRRESSLLMGLPPRGLIPQGTTSRIREESPW
ncbi:unnamed protein product [Discula destructiva]